MASAIGTYTIVGLHAPSTYRPSPHELLSQITASDRSEILSVPSPVIRSRQMSFPPGLFGTTIYNYAVSSFSIYYVLYDNGEIRRSLSPELRRFAQKYLAISKVRAPMKD